MNQQERDEAVNRAIDAGETEVLGAIVNVPSILTGHLTTPVSKLIDFAVDKAAPEARENIQAIERGLDHLRLALEAFGKSAGEMRDKGLERSGTEGAEKAIAATAAFDAAVA